MCAALRIRDYERLYSVCCGDVRILRLKAGELLNHPQVVLLSVPSNLTFGQPYGIERVCNQLKLVKNTSQGGFDLQETGGSL